MPYLRMNLGQGHGHEAFSGGVICTMVGWTISSSTWTLAVSTTVSYGVESIKAESRTSHVAGSPCTTAGFAASHGDALSGSNVERSMPHGYVVETLRDASVMTEREGRTNRRSGVWSLAGREKTSQSCIVYGVLYVTCSRNLA